MTKELFIAGMTKELKVFIAGSLALEHVRDAVRSALMNVSFKYEKMGLALKSLTFENFDNSICEDGRQMDYNDFIKNKADFVIFILDGDIHDKTLEEFEYAIDGFRTFKRPKIFVYNNIESDTGNEVIKRFKQRMTELNQYWTDYRPGQLKSIVRTNFDDALFNIMHQNLEAPKFDASKSLGPSWVSNYDARKLDILFKQYTLSSANELYDSLVSSTKSVLMMIQSMADEGPEFKMQKRYTEDLMNALNKNREILPQDLYEIAYDIAVDYPQKGFNWVLDKVRTSIAAGKENFNSTELQALHDELIHDIINWEDAQNRINNFSDKLTEYLNSL